MSNNVTKNGESLKVGQHRANPLDVAWLAGVIDGEGSLVAQYIRNRDGEVVGVGVNVRISNTSQKLMDKAARTVEAICFKKPAILKHSDVGGKRCFTLNICGQTAIKALCEAILFHVTIKRTQCAHMIAFLESRKRSRHTHKSKSKYDKGHVTFTDVEWAFPETLKRLKAAEFTYIKAGGVETERDAPQEIARCG